MTIRSFTFLNSAPRKKAGNLNDEYSVFYFLHANILLNGEAVLCNFARIITIKELPS